MSGVHQEYVANQAHAVNAPLDPALFQGFVQRIGFQFEHEQQAEPGKLVDRGGEFFRPLQEAAALAQHVRDEQQRVNRPLDQLTLVQALPAGGEAGGRGFRQAMISKLKSKNHTPMP
jgi:hypothetical protein